MIRLDPHHRKLRSQGGDDSWGNQIKLPRNIHDLIHENPDVAYQHGMLVREHEDPATIEPDLVGFLQSVGVESEPEVEPKPKKQKLEGEARRKRRKISINVPADQEEGGALWDEMMDRVKDRLVSLGAWKEKEEIAYYEGIMAALQDWLDS